MPPKRNKKGTAKPQKQEPTEENDPAPATARKNIDEDARSPTPGVDKSVPPLSDCTNEISQELERLRELVSTRIHSNTPAQNRATTETASNLRAENEQLIQQLEEMRSKYVEHVTVLRREVMTLRSESRSGAHSRSMTPRATASSESPAVPRRIEIPATSTCLERRTHFIRNGPMMSFTNSYCSSCAYLKRCVKSAQNAVSAAQERAAAAEEGKHISPLPTPRQSTLREEKSTANKNHDEARSHSKATDEEAGTADHAQTEFEREMLMKELVEAEVRHRREKNQLRDRIGKLEGQLARLYNMHNAQKKVTKHSNRIASRKHSLLKEEEVTETHPTSMTTAVVTRHNFGLFKSIDELEQQIRDAASPEKHGHTAQRKKKSDQYLDFLANDHDGPPLSAGTLVQMDRRSKSAPNAPRGLVGGGLVQSGTATPHDRERSLSVEMINDEESLLRAANLLNTPMDQQYTASSSLPHHHNHHSSSLLLASLVEPEVETNVVWEETVSYQLLPVSGRTDIQAVAKWWIHTPTVPSAADAAPTAGTSVADGETNDKSADELSNTATPNELAPRGPKVQDKDGFRAPKSRPKTEEQKRKDAEFAAAAAAAKTPQSRKDGRPSSAFQRRKVLPKARPIAFQLGLCETALNAGMDSVDPNEVAWCVGGCDHQTEWKVSQSQDAVLVEEPSKKPSADDDSSKVGPFWEGSAVHWHALEVAEVPLLTVTVVERPEKLE